MYQVDKVSSLFIVLYSQYVFALVLAEKTDSSETNDDFSVDVDISLTKPPSFASSTKVFACSIVILTIVDVMISISYRIVTNDYSKS